MKDDAYVNFSIGFFVFYQTIWKLSKRQLELCSQFFVPTHANVRSGITYLNDLSKVGFLKVNFDNTTDVKNPPPSVLKQNPFPQTLKKHNRIDLAYELTSPVLL